MGISKFLLLVSYVPKSPPGVIMCLIDSQCSLVASLAILKVLIGYKLMATKCVSIREVRIDLYGSAKEFQSCFMLFL